MVTHNTSMKSWDADYEHHFKDTLSAADFNFLIDYIKLANAALDLR